MNLELSAEIRFRCPHCQKLFCTDQTAFETEKADFECTECHQEFWLSKKMLGTGLYETSVKQKKSFSNCPKCSFLKPIEQDECPSCGVLASKFNEIQKIENPRLFEFNRAWQAILRDISKDESHQHFLNLAQKQSALNFAAQKYNELKKIMGQDPLIETYLKQIEGRLEAHLQAQVNKAKAQTQVRGQQEILRDRVFIFFALLGTFLFIFNKIRPTFPNLNGLIVAVTVLFYGLWFLSRTSSFNKEQD